MNKLIAILACLKTASGTSGVDYFYETGCPSCDKRLPAVLKQATFAGASLELHPFGNAYFVMSECAGTGAYDKNARKCWDKLCGQAATPKAADCFTGEMVCQHGPNECSLNKYVACAKQHTNKDINLYGEFAKCVDTRFRLAIQAGRKNDPGLDSVVAQLCAEGTTLNLGHIKACAVGQDGVTLMQQEGSIVPPHTVVPVLLLNGQDVPVDAFLEARERRLLV